MNIDGFNQIMESTISTIEATNNIDSNSNNNLTYNQICNICPPRKDLYFPISVADIEKLKLQCNKNKKSLIIVSDILLTFASLFLGAIFSALISKIEFRLDFIPILFYCISPTIGFSCLIACIFTKRMSKENENQLSEKINEYIVEPFEVSQKENNNEH